MNRIITIIFLLFSLSLAGQVNKLKVKKPITQDKMTTVVTIAGLYYGTCSIDSFLLDTKLKFSNNTDSLKIIGFDIDFSASGTIHFFKCQSDSLSKEVIDTINSLRKSSNLKIWISQIKAIAKNQDVIFLNPIEIKLKD